MELALALGGWDVTHRKCLVRKRPDRHSPEATGISCAGRLVRWTLAPLVAVGRAILDERYQSFPVLGRNGKAIVMHTLTAAAAGCLIDSRRTKAALATRHGLKRQLIAAIAQIRVQLNGVANDKRGRHCARRTCECHSSRSRNTVPLQQRAERVSHGLLPPSKTEEPYSAV